MNDDNAQFRIALTGCGRISQVHLHTIVHEPRAKLVAVADVDKKVAESTAEMHGLEPFYDTEKMLEKIHPDALIICTPPNTHRKLAEFTLNAGIHVLCEKPLALSVEDADAMVEAANRNKRVLMMASKFRYVRDVIQAKNIIESGILGEIILFENEFCARVDMKNRWNALIKVAGGGVLIDNGSHSVDIVRYLLGPINDLQAIFGKRWQDIEVEDTCRLFVRCSDGIIGSIDLSWSIHKENPYFIHIYGTAGVLEVGWKTSRYRQSEKVDWVSFGNGYDKFKAVGSQLTNFIETITGEGKPIIKPEDAVESVRVIQSAYLIANQNHWEKVKP
jgi:predicted dehydrogenase